LQLSGTLTIGQLTRLLAVSHHHHHQITKLSHSINAIGLLLV
jgi:hypothetical protein